MLITAIPPVIQSQFKPSDVKHAISLPGYVWTIVCGNWWVCYALASAACIHQEKLLITNTSSLFEKFALAFLSICSGYVSLSFSFSLSISIFLYIYLPTNLSIYFLYVILSSQFFCSFVFLSFYYSSLCFFCLSIRLSVAVPVSVSFVPLNMSEWFFL